MNVAVTALAFSAVLAEMFTAVGLSTVVPNLFVEACRALKALGTGTLSNPDLLAFVGQFFSKFASSIPGLPQAPAADAPADKWNDYTKAITPFITNLQKMLSTSDTLQLLVPKGGYIDASFSCSGRESYEGEASVLGVFEVVGVKAGFSALFEMKSSTTLKLHVDFAAVEYTL